MSNPKKLTDTLRNWNIAKSYLKNGPSLPNIIKALKYILDGMNLPYLKICSRWNLYIKMVEAYEKK